MSHSAISFYLRQCDLPSTEDSLSGVLDVFVLRGGFIIEVASLTYRRVQDAVRSVGHSYGRQTMHGFLHSQNLHVSQYRIGRARLRVAPRPTHIRRTRTYRQTNHVPYQANYYSEKLHLDHNEKIVMFGSGWLQ